MLFAAKKPLLSAAEFVKCLLFSAFRAKISHIFALFLLNYSFCAESVMKDDREFFGTIDPDLSNQLTDDAVLEVRYICACLCYLREESVESAVNVKRRAYLGLFNLNDLSQIADICGDAFELIFKILLISSFGTNLYNSHHVIFLFLELRFKACNTDVRASIDEGVTESCFQFILDRILIFNEV